MALSNRITYTTALSATGGQGGWHLAEAVRMAIKAKQEIKRALSMANEITGGGVTPVNLEGSVEFGAAVGQGLALYNAINNFSANIANLTDAALADLDTGG